MSELLEPDFIERDPEKIEQEWIQLFEEKTGKVLLPSQIERLYVDIGAYRETVIRMKIQEAAKKNLLTYAPLTVLEHIGQPLGVTKLLANCSKTVIKFSVDELLDFDFVIKQGTEVETKDGLFIFQTIENVILKEGNYDVSVEAICETPGEASNNYIIGSINNLITPLNYISNVGNTTISSGGADDEGAESLRERIRQAPEKFSNAGSRGAYKYHTYSAHQSIIDAAVISPSPGVVCIYPLTKDGLPSDEILKTVHNYLYKDGIRPLTDFVQVKSPECISFSIKATLLLYSYADIETVQKTINAKLNEYKIHLSEKLGKDVVGSQIITILNSIYGVYKVILESPANDINLEEYQWAELKNFDINIGGFVDE